MSVKDELQITDYFNLDIPARPRNDCVESDMLNEKLHQPSEPTGMVYI